MRNKMEKRSLYSGKRDLYSGKCSLYSGKRSLYRGKCSLVSESVVSGVESVACIKLQVKGSNLDRSEWNAGVYDLPVRTLMCCSAKTLSELGPNRKSSP